jgi:hypothetical protein
VLVFAGEAEAVHLGVARDQRPRGSNSIASFRPGARPPAASTTPARTYSSCSRARSATNRAVGPSGASAMAPAFMLNPVANISGSRSSVPGASLASLTWCATRA